MKKLLFLFVFSFVLYGNLFAQINLDSGLVAKYYFNGNADDESIFGNHGTAYNTVLASDRAGNLNQAYCFNGTTSYIKVPNSPSLTIQKSISICAWIKTSDADIYSDPNGGFIVSKAYTNSSRAYTLVANDGTLGDSIVVQLYNTSNTQFRTVKFSNYYNDKWHFLVTTYDYISGICKIYVDSILVTSKTVGQINLMQTTVPLSIGCFWNNSTGTLQRGFYNGLIDDVRLYNRAINQAEVAALYNETVVKSEIIEFNNEEILFPNPCDGSINLNLYSEKPEKAFIKVYDINGKLVLSISDEIQSGENNLKLDLGKVPSGVYNVFINAGDRNIVKKISVIR